MIIKIAHDELNIIESEFLIQYFKMNGIIVLEEVIDEIPIKISKELIDNLYRETPNFQEKKFKTDYDFKIVITDSIYTEDASMIINLNREKNKQNADLITEKVIEFLNSKKIFLKSEDVEELSYKILTCNSDNVNYKLYYNDFSNKTDLLKKIIDKLLELKLINEDEKEILYMTSEAYVKNNGCALMLRPLAQRTLNTLEDEKPAMNPKTENIIPYYRNMYNGLIDISRQKITKNNYEKKEFYFLKYATMKIVLNANIVCYRNKIPPAYRSDDIDYFLNKMVIDYKEKQSELALLLAQNSFLDRNSVKSVDYISKIDNYTSDCCDFMCEYCINDDYKRYFIFYNLLSYYNDNYKFKNVCELFSQFYKMSVKSSEFSRYKVNNLDEASRQMIDLFLNSVNNNLGRKIENNCLTATEIQYLVDATNNLIDLSKKYFLDLNKKALLIEKVINILKNIDNLDTISISFITEEDKKEWIMSRKKDLYSLYPTLINIYYSMKNFDKSNSLCIEQEELKEKILKKK